MPAAAGVAQDVGEQTLFPACKRGHKALVELLGFDLHTVLPSLPTGDVGKGVL
jgi:hypothetical protein